MRYYRGLGIHETSEAYKEDMEMMLKISKTAEDGEPGINSRLRWRDFGESPRED